jgi:type IX secretion system PorP/SprF family membrane protein
LKSQQIPHLSQYNLNRYAINPAATGINDVLPLSFSYRKLWAGIDRSPAVQYLSGHMKIADYMGAGVKIFNYQAGFSRKSGIEATYSYHINIDQNETKLSFGLSGLLYQFFLDKAELSIEEPDDAVFLGTDKMIVPDATFGVYLYGESFYAGLAIPQLFNRSIDLKTDRVLQQRQVRHYYLHGGYNYEINTLLKLEPSLLLKFVEAGLFQADIKAYLTYLDMVSFGLSYRTEDAIVIQFSYKNSDFLIGYSFDLTLSGLKTKAFGSHEIIFMYSLPNFIK